MQADPVQPIADAENQDGPIKAKLTIIKKKEKKKQKVKKEDPVEMQEAPITESVEEVPAKKAKKRKEEIKEEKLKAPENTEKVIFWLCNNNILLPLSVDLV